MYRSPSGYNSWSPEVIVLLRQLANEGLSFGQIAVVFSKNMGKAYTRNMIQGACYRNGIVTRYIRPPKPKAVNLHVRAVASVPLVEPEPIGKPGDIPLVGCRFIRGEFTRNFRMCGHPGNPWCAYHRVLVRGSQKPLIKVP